MRSLLALVFATLTPDTTRGVSLYDVIQVWHQSTSKHSCDAYVVVHVRVGKLNPAEKL